jgi:hypothetical protein
MRTRKEADFIFTWYSKTLAEMQSAARILSRIGLFRKTRKELYIAEIDRGAESVRKILLEELFRDVE